MDFWDLNATESRRRFLRNSGFGIGVIALAQLLAEEGRGTEVAPVADPMAPKKPHFSPKAKNVIFLFMAGAPSQLDLFEPKPALTKYHNQPIPDSMKSALVDTFKQNARLMASPREFKRYGQSGMPFSDLLPHTGSCADDICMMYSLRTDITNHHPAQLILNCGTSMFGRPSMGSWVTYGLGSESRNLPGFVVLTSTSGLGIEGGASNWASGFLPSNYRGVTFRSTGDPVLYLSNPHGLSGEAQRLRLDAISDLNQHHLQSTGDIEIAARTASYELAFRMQTSVPELGDFSKESASTLEMYGIHNEVTRPFGTNCLLARRMIERGVRFVQLYHSSWDDHADLNKKITKNCSMIDQPTAALLRDLKQRGLLDTTLVVWGGEFGRTPMYEVRLASPEPGKEGRDHHALAFAMWAAGGGIKGGLLFGKTDDIGFQAIENQMHVHDLQATILHCLGLDHTRLTYRHQGRDFRLTDVAGNVVHEVLT
ncbi:MAG: sulfatase [Acidobacteria bacterium]|nr:MAG: sulfatase [Acidobacteriota bacterium]